MRSTPEVVNRRSSDTSSNAEKVSETLQLVRTKRFDRKNGSSVLCELCENNLLVYENGNKENVLFLVRLAEVSLEVPNFFSEGVSPFSFKLVRPKLIIHLSCPSEASWSKWIRSIAPKAASVRGGDDSFVKMFSDAAVVASVGGIVLAANEQLVRLFGYGSAAECLGQRIEMFMPDEVAAVHSRFMNANLSHHQYRMVGRPRAVKGKKADGSLFSVMLCLGAVNQQSGPSQYFVATFTAMDGAAPPTAVVETGEFLLFSMACRKVPVNSKKLAYVLRHFNSLELAKWQTLCLTSVLGTAEPVTATFIHQFSASESGEASGEVVLRNVSNVPITFRPRHSVDGSQLSVHATPKSLKLAPGASGTLHLKMTALKSGAGGREPLQIDMKPIGASMFLWLSLSSVNKTRSIQSDSIVMGTSIGSSTYANVYRATWKGQQVAVKIYHGPAASEMCAAESEILATVSHPCIVSFVGTTMTRTGEPAVVTEFAEHGSLDVALASGNKALLASSELRIKMAVDVAFALDYLHGSGLCHGDVIPANVLLVSLSANAKVNAKLCGLDHGVLTLRSSSPTSTQVVSPQNSLRKRSHGDLTAPELRRGEPYESPADVWAFGLLLYQLVALQKPFTQEAEGLTTSLMQQSPELVRVYKGCTDPQPTTRLSAHRVSMFLLSYMDAPAPDMRENSAVKFRRSSVPTVTSIPAPESPGSAYSGSMRSAGSSPSHAQSDMFGSSGAPFAWSHSSSHSSHSSSSEALDAMESAHHVTLSARCVVPVRLKDCLKLSAGEVVTISDHERNFRQPFIYVTHGREIGKVPVSALNLSIHTTNVYLRVCDKLLESPALLRDVLELAEDGDFPAGFVTCFGAAGTFEKLLRIMIDDERKEKARRGLQNEILRATTPAVNLLMLAFRHESLSLHRDKLVKAMEAALKPLASGNDDEPLDTAVVECIACLERSGPLPPLLQCCLNAVGDTDLAASMFCLRFLGPALLSSSPSYARVVRVMQQVSNGTAQDQQNSVTFRELHARFKKAVLLACDGNRPFVIRESVVLHAHSLYAFLKARFPERQEVKDLTNSLGAPAVGAVMSVEDVPLYPEIEMLRDVLRGYWNGT